MIDLTPRNLPSLVESMETGIASLQEYVEQHRSEYEESIRIDYLKSLNERYEAWIKKYKLGKLLVISVDDIDFAENPKDLGMVIEKINAEIHGLF